MEQTVRKKKPRQRRIIIERPRLIKALDSSKARLRMLVAPAGYGKTTLAEQWTSKPGRNAVWYQCRNASADVAVLSTGVADEAATLLPGCNRRLRERLLASRNPADEIDILAEILAEDLLAWPSDTWLVVDDYHLAARLPEAERFVEVLFARSPVNVLLASRQRPSWVSGRDILYGDVLELNQTELAMIHEEAAQLLSGEHASMTSGLVALANGWPAVLALAGVSEVTSLPTDDPAWTDRPPEALYEFFAEEVYRGLDQATQSGLVMLALAPRLDRQVAEHLLGARRVDDVIRRTAALGIIHIRSNELLMHPLARKYVEDRVRFAPKSHQWRAIRRTIRLYARRRDWNSALELIERTGARSELVNIMPTAVRDLLDNGRLASIEQWLRAASEVEDLRPVANVAAAELALRQGQLVVAETLARNTVAHAEPGSPLMFRGLFLAGRASHIASRELEALEFFANAERVATDEDQRREALWGKLMAATALERDEAFDLLELLAPKPRQANPREHVRYADKELALGLRFGAIPSLETARNAEQLLPLVADPFVRCSFRSVYSFALALSAYYNEGERAAAALIDDANDSRVEFGLTYGHTTRALALAGLRRFDEAHEHLDQAFDVARRCGDAYGEQNVYAARVRVLLQEQRFVDARRLEPPDLSFALPSMLGEVAATRALAYACLGRLDEALRMAESAPANTRAIEPAVLAVAVKAVVDVKSRGGQAIDSATSLLDRAFSSGAVDLFVTTYRASPDVAGLLLTVPACIERTMFALARSGDSALLGGFGVSPEEIYDPVSRLSAREREIYDLVCRGVPNRAIAKELFISEATVKVHVHHIFDKLGVRSRHALALTAAGSRAFNSEDSMSESS